MRFPRKVELLEFCQAFNVTGRGSCLSAGAVGTYFGHAGVYVFKEGALYPMTLDDCVPYIPAKFVSISSKFKVIEWQ